MSTGGKVLICAAKRTPIGSFQGALSSLTAVELGVAAVKAALRDSRVTPEAVDEIIMGCVLSTALGQAPARQVGISSGLPSRAQAMTVNKVCSSGLKAVMLAAQSIQLGSSACVVAGGMESMSRAPYALPSLRSGARLGNTEAIDTIVKDGLWDVYNDFHMGNAAELCAREGAITREEQDAFAIESYRRAQSALESGAFAAEIVPVDVKEGKSQVTVSADEEPGRVKLEKIPQLKPAFDPKGTVTAANASSINDGAAALVLCSEKFAVKHHLTPVAEIVEQGFAAQAPEWFTTAPIAAVNHVLERAGLKTADIDLFEINEAFSCVAIACLRGLQVPADKLNVHGGAVALGHPIGASGARILTTLLHGLRLHGGRRGVAAVCNGGGEATAILVELIK